MYVHSRFLSLRNVVKDRRCVACKLHLHSSIQLTNTSDTLSIPYSGSLLQQINFFCNIRRSGCMLVCPMLRVELRCCATCACTVDILYMYPIPKHTWRAQLFNVLARRRTVYLLQRRVWGLGTAQSCTCAMYTSQFEHKYESWFVLLSYFRTNIQTSVRSFHP